VAGRLSSTAKQGTQVSSKVAPIHAPNQLSPTACFAEAYKFGRKRTRSRLWATLEIASRAAESGTGDFVEVVSGESASKVFPILYYLACTDQLEERVYHLLVTDSDKGSNELAIFKYDSVKWNHHWDRNDRHRGLKQQTWKQIETHLQIRVGKIGDIMPGALYLRSVAALYCNNKHHVDAHVTYASAMDCLKGAGPSLQPQAWIYHTEYYAFPGNREAVTDWRHSIGDIGRIALVPKEEWIKNPTVSEIFEDATSVDCSTPREDATGKCRIDGKAMLVEGGYWMPVAAGVAGRSPSVGLVSKRESLSSRVDSGVLKSRSSPRNNSPHAQPINVAKGASGGYNFTVEGKSCHDVPPGADDRKSRWVQIEPYQINKHWRVSQTPFLLQFSSLTLSMHMCIHAHAHTCIFMHVMFCMCMFIYL
jgi:hypothetical protein